MVRSVTDSIAFHYLSRPHWARGALLSLSKTHSTEASLHTFCETSHPQCLWLQELFITEERDCMARELATCLTHFSVGVIAFPVSLLFHFGKMPKLSQLNPGWRCFAVHFLSVLLSFELPPTPSFHLCCWLKLVSNAWTRGIQTNSVTAHSLMHSKGKCLLFLIFYFLLSPSPDECACSLFHKLKSGDSGCAFNCYSISSLI